MSGKILQYVVMRKDLIATKKSSATFSLGANMAQACHAATAAIFKNYDSPATVEYLQELEDMTVCVLGIDNGEELEALSRTLKEHMVPCHLWIEKPELVPTSLATAPVRKEMVGPLLSHLKLLR